MPYDFGTVVRFGSMRLEIEYTPLEGDEGGTLNGQVSCGEERLQLNSDQTERQMAMAMIHELVHVIEETRGVELDENAVVAFEYGLADLMSQNPDLFFNLVQCLSAPR